MEELTINQTKAEAFADRLVNMLNEGIIGIMLSIGHRTGLLDVMAEMLPATSEEIATQSGLNERYVREWLGCMVTGKIVEYNPLLRYYHLPPEHATFLTRKAKENNIATFMQYFAVLGCVEDEIVKAFSHGKGVPYSAYPRFHQVMAEESQQTVIYGLDKYILPLIPGIQEQLREGIKVLDMGCGSGKAMIYLASNYPASSFYGYDISEEGISAANQVVQEKGLMNATFIVKDAALVDEENQYDLITAFDAIHDQPKPDQVLSNIHKALKPGGVFLMQDIAASSFLENNLDHPVAPMLYGISTMHCMSVSLAADGPGLGAVWGKEKALEMLAEAGFNDVKVKQLPHDIQNYFYVMHKTAAAY